MTSPSNSLNDDLVFLDEMPGAQSAAPCVPGPRWRILIVDDDRDVHSATTFALANLEMQQRQLEFLHAYSANQARELLASEADIAVILLDVVMEAEDSGLELVRHIRETLQQTEVRIILRTGQPGYAPELDAIRDYDINDYKTKSELTRTKLYTTVTTAIRSYEQIRTISIARNGLDRVVRASSVLMSLHELDDFAAAVLTQAGALLDRELHGFVCVQEQPNPDGPLILAAAGRHAELLATYLHPDHRPEFTPALKQVFSNRHNVYGPDYTVLYLGGSGTRVFAALFDSDMPIAELQRRLLSVFCRNVAVGLDNVLLLNRLHSYAFYDPLTKLANRARLKELIEEALEATSREGVTLALVDIDHFAETNDALGHQFGDLLLVGVAARLHANFGDRLTLARVGGDTFGVLGDAALVNPSVLLALFEQPFVIDGQQVQVTATVGLLHLADCDGGGADALKDADIALKRAKLLQRAGHFYFSRSMGVDVRERVGMMHALRNARERKELFVVYQPQIDLA
ncbi:MAG TPA: DUF3369 domain-containing protein, partial [Noviherbaspirillum sp.]